MIKLVKYLKPFIFGFLLTIVLLFVQAVCDLNLPNYMSKIVNIGIQKNGIEDGVPEVISQSGYEFVKSFMSEDEADLLDKSYVLTDSRNTAKGNKTYADIYPATTGKLVYGLKNDIDTETTDALNTAFGTSVWTFVNVMKTIGEQGLQNIMLQDDTPSGENFINRPANPGEGRQLPDDAQGAMQRNPQGGRAVIAPEGVELPEGERFIMREGTSDGSPAFDENRMTDSFSMFSDGEMNLSDIDITNVYGLTPIIKRLPAEVINAAREEAVAKDSATLNQTATVMVSSFYKELGVDIQAYQRNYIINVGLQMLLIAVLSGIATILVSLISSRVAAGVARNLRNDIFEKVAQFSNAEFDKFSTASLITRSTNDVTQIQMLLAMGIRMICYAPIMGIGGIIMALRRSVSMGWILAIAVVVLVGLIMIVFSIVIPKFKSIQKFIDRVNLVARETLNGLMVIRAFGTSDFEKDRFDKANKDLARTNLFVNRIMTFMMPIMMLIMNGTTVLVIWVGSHQVMQSSMQVGDMMAFMQYAMQVIMSFLMVSMMFIFIPRAAVSAQRISEVLEIEPAIKDPENPKSMNNNYKGLVEFRNVSFRYTGAELDALENITFTAKPGETTAFIGATGSGKSTLVNLIPRFYDVTAGEVLVGGVNVKELSQKELRSRIGYVPQKSVLMSGTIESNIKYGDDDLSTEEISKSAEVAQALEFINSKEDGFDSEISQGGTNVSGGQKQRLSIARALAIKPDIYIFDDSLSALDFKTDAALRKAFNANTIGSTDIIVAQRVSTIMNADCIYVIDNGKIVGSGTHGELLKTCPEYREIALSQLGEGGIDNE